MGKCLVTRLQEAVNDNNLPYYGGITVNVYHLDNPDTYAHKLRVNPATTMKIVGSGTVTVDNTDYTSSSGIVTLAGDKNLVFSNDTFKVILFCKYSDNQFIIAPFSGATDAAMTGYVDRGISIDLSQFDYTRLTDISMNGVKLSGKVKNLKYARYFDIVNASNNSYNPCSLKIDSTDFTENTALIHFQYAYQNRAQYEASGSDINIKLTDLYNKTALTRLHAGYCDVVGDVVDFAAGQVAASRTSGTIEVKLAHSGATVDGTYWTQTAIRDKYGLSSTVWTLVIYFGTSYTKGYVIKVGNTTIIQ